ncbi:MAG: putative xylanase/chitin deacetylase [Rhodobacteraceae bacterium HLUCCA12]|nr:MAG: putative xylanase/chitin deacetylase [Rhodobacteraceae bacterium HLUCCA12]
MLGLGSWCLANAGVSLATPAQGRTATPAAMPRLTRAHGVINLSRVETDRPQVALTFDDGPHPQHTPRLLDILAEHRVRATFYVIGSLVHRYPAIVQRIVAEGHELGNHTWAHPTLSRHGDHRILSEIDRTQEIIWQTTGHLPVTFRPPYGAITPRQSRMLHASRNLPTVVWSVDPQDWRRPGPAVVAQRMLQGAGPGAIILAHDIHAATVAAVPEALNGLYRRGLDCVTLSELIGWGRWGPEAPYRHRIAGAGSRRTG